MTSYGWPAPPPQPGLVPLRPLTIGELMSVGVKVAWRNLPVLAPIALVVTIVQTGVQLAILAATGNLHLYVSGDWARVPARPTNAEAEAFLGTFWHVLGALSAASAVGILLVGIVVGPAAAGVASATLGQPTPRAILTRLQGRWGVVIGTSALSGLVQLGGYILLVVPGILAWIFLMPAVPVAAVEGGTPRSALRRGLQLSRGFRPRLFGVTLLISLFGGITGFVVGSVVGAAGRDGGSGMFVLTTVVTILLAAFVVPWTATVTALLYVDIRFRREGLAQALAASVTPG